MKVRLPFPFSFEKSKNLISVLLKRASDFVGSNSCWNETKINVRTASIVGFITQTIFCPASLEEFRIWSFFAAISGKIS